MAVCEDLTHTATARDSPMYLNISDTQSDLSDPVLTANTVEKVGFQKARKQFRRLRELTNFGYGGRLERSDLFVAIARLSDRKDLHRIRRKKAYWQKFSVFTIRPFFNGIGQ